MRGRDPGDPAPRVPQPAPPRVGGVALPVRHGRPYRLRRRPRLRFHDGRACRSAARREADQAQQHEGSQWLTSPPSPGSGPGRRSLVGAVATGSVIGRAPSLNLPNSGTDQRHRPDPRVASAATRTADAVIPDVLRRRARGSRSAEPRRATRSGRGPDLPTSRAERTPPCLPDARPRAQRVVSVTRWGSPDTPARVPLLAAGPAKVHPPGRMIVTSDPGSTA